MRIVHLILETRKVIEKLYRNSLTSKRQKPYHHRCKSHQKCQVCFRRNKRLFRSWVKRMHHNLRWAKDQRKTKKPVQIKKLFRPITGLTKKNSKRGVWDTNQNCAKHLVVWKSYSSSQCFRDSDRIKTIKHLIDTSQNQSRMLRRSERRRQTSLSSKKPKSRRKKKSSKRRKKEGTYRLWSSLCTIMGRRWILKMGRFRVCVAVGLKWRTSDR